jgi:hypothetical protein
VIWIQRLWRRLIGKPATPSVAVERGPSLRGSLSADLHPGNTTRDWRQRWDLIRVELGQIESPAVGEMSAKATHEARNRLHTFYISTYHLKDALKLDATATGVSDKTIEDEISNTPALALLADLANLDKHGKLDRPPRSGHVPVIMSESARRSSTDQPDWVLVLEIEHAGITHDGIDIARRAVAAWDNFLRRMKLV